MLLSICIPSYNRARLLAEALEGWGPQVTAAGGAVELLVSDNCSTDDTAEVVRRAASAGVPLRYHRNAANIGACGNIVLIADSLAAGEFVWIVGDDDLPVPGAVEKVLAVLRSHPGIDYLFVNTSPKPSSERHRFLGPSADFSPSALSPARAKDPADKPLERFEQVIDPDVDDVFLGAIMCSVFRTSRWRYYRVKLRDPPGGKGPRFTTLGDTYPHCVNFARTLVGRPAYYVGQPCTVAFWGAQEWKGYVPMIVLVRLHEMLDLYEQNGVAPDRIRRCRRHLLRDAAAPIRAILLSRPLPGRRYFSLGRYVWRNRHFPLPMVRMFCSAAGLPLARAALDRLSPGARRAVVTAVRRSVGRLGRRGVARRRAVPSKTVL